MSQPLISVVDVETTGLFTSRHHRVVELAVVQIDLDGNVQDEYCTLINPDRDIGARSIHGITASDLVHAPNFAEVVHDVVGRLSPCSAVAARNVRFDVDFLSAEFSRIGSCWPGPLPVCTMELAGGGNLSDACDDWGLEPPDESHSAIHDARAAARLLGACLRHHATVREQVANSPCLKWPEFQPGRSPLTRDLAKAQQERPIFLQRLASRLGPHAQGRTSSIDRLAYLALLDRCLEDRVIDDTETDALIETAENWGLSRSGAMEAHAEYLRQLCVAALADGQVTDAERQDLHTVARMLGQSVDQVDATLEAVLDSISKHFPRRNKPDDLRGKKVCFTGELTSTLNGEIITRELAHSLAAAAGLEISTGVTKSLDLLVVADPNTRSGKAKKARDYGIQILAEPVFWGRIGVITD